MKLFHLTPDRNRGSILVTGLDPARSRGRRRRVWLCTAALVPWAQKHVAKHQNVRPEALALLVVDVPRRVLTRVRRGVYTCPRHIPAERIT